MTLIATYTPSDYSGFTRQEMINAGLVRIEIYSDEKIIKSTNKYYFSDGTVLNSTRDFRKRVYNE
jgi:hypothetical protein